MTKKEFIQLWVIQNSYKVGYQVEHHISNATDAWNIIEKAKFKEK
jgi:hypothetical protein